MPQAFDFEKGLILKDSWPFSIKNSANPFLEMYSLPLINLVKFFFLTKLFLILAVTVFSELTPKDKYKKGKTKNLKHAAEEIGLPGNPKKIKFLLNFANIIGFPGLIDTPLKDFFNLNLLRTLGTKSNFPAEIAPDVITIFVFDFK